jgi:hypothetical protein
MDCQFIMALCTWVHYNTFVKLATVSVPKLFYMYGLLSDAEKKEFLDQIRQTLQAANPNNHNHHHRRGGGRRMDDFSFK